MVSIKLVISGFVAAIAIWLGSPVPGTAEGIQTVHLVQDSDYPPFMIAKKTGPAGIYAEIIRAADDRLDDYNIELSASSWPRAKYLVATGQANGLVGTYFKPRRRPWIRHFSSPLATETVFLYCREGVADESWAYPDDYIGLLFSNNIGFATPGDRFFELVDDGKIEIIEEQTTEKNLRLLHLGRADCYVQEKAAVETALRANKFDMVRPVREVLVEPAHIGYSEHWSAEDGDDFIAQMDRVLEEMEQDGTIRTIIAKWTSGTL